MPRRTSKHSALKSTQLDMSHTFRQLEPIKPAVVEAGSIAGPSDNRHNVSLGSPQRPMGALERSNTAAVPLSPTLSTRHIPLSNSLILDGQAWECFNYIPSSVLVLYVNKPWKWSMLSYLHSTIATHEKGVMSAFIAVAAMELSCLNPSMDQDAIESDSLHFRRRRLQRLGLEHYRLALRDLSSVLERAAKDDRTAADLDSLFAMWFLILNFELYKSDLTEISHMHLNGIRSFLSKCCPSDGSVGGLKLPPASQQLLLFTKLNLSTP